MNDRQDKRTIPGPNSDDKDIGQILRVFWSRKLTILAGVIAGASLAFVLAQQTPPYYLAEGMMMIETREITLPQLGSTMVTNASDPRLARSHGLVLQSRDLAESVMYDLNLEEDPEFNPFLRPPSRAVRILAELWQRLPERWRDWLADQGFDAPGNRPAEIPAGHTRAAVVETFLDKLEVTTDDESYIILIEYESWDPKRGADVVNTLMTVFVADQLLAKTQTTLDTNAWLNERLADLEQGVDEADQRVTEFRTKHALVETQQGTVISQQLNEINSQLTLARAERSQAEAAYGRAADEALETGSAVGSMEVMTSDLIQRLRDREAEVIQREAEASVRLGENHPQRQALRAELADVRAQVQSEVQRVLTALRNAAQVTRTREQTLERQLARIQAQATESAESGVLLRQLEEEAETKRGVYQAFLMTAQETARPSPVNEADVRIVSRAAPPVTPAGPRVGLIGIVGGFGGFLFAAAGIMLRGEVRRGFATLSELESATGLPILGVLPAFGTWRRFGNGLADYVAKHPTTPIAEAIRGVRVALSSGAEALQPKVVVVTSVSPHDGKTSLVTAMGVLGAKDGKRILLIDSDLRRPRLSTMLDGRGSSSGLEEVLAGTTKWTDAVRLNHDSGLHYLCASARTKNAQGLLTSPRWQAFLDEAIRFYELVIIDSPPVFPVSDAITLAQYADAVVLVIGWRATARDAVAEALRRLRISDRPIAGLVVTKASKEILLSKYDS